MKLHEHQAKTLLSEYRVPVPLGRVADSVDQVRTGCEALGLPVVVKAQVHAGGRGKAGGVISCASSADVEEVARRLLGQRLVTAQSGPGGLPVSSLLLETPLEIERECYLAMLVDRAAERIVLVGSAAGGMNIEEIAVQRPEALLTQRIEPALGLRPWQCRRLGRLLGLSGTEQHDLEQILQRLYQLFIDCDASLLEINPLAITRAGALVALDAKVELDDNALDRHPRLAALQDRTQEDAREVAARAEGLNYISLDGNIGCMVNGAGLAMATMDLIALHGGQPANFLDVGGGATTQRVARAFRLILSDPRVSAILVNIFGGIVRCDLIADGILEAVREIGVRVPIVARLEGTNAALGLERLANSDLQIDTAATLEDAAEQAVKAALARASGDDR